MLGIAYQKLAYVSPRYNLSPAVKTYRRHLNMRSRSASQKDYQLISSKNKNKKQLVKLCTYDLNSAMDLKAWV